MTSKERIIASLNHRQPDRVPIDFGSSPVTGIHVLAVENLRKYFGLEARPVKVIEPYQMLGEIDAELGEALGIDVIGIGPRKNMFGFPNERWKEFKTFWGQTVLVPNEFKTKYETNGSLLIYPEGDTAAEPSGRMPASGYFFDTIIRQEPINDEELKVEDNLEEFSLISDEDLNYWKDAIDSVDYKNKAVLANFGGTAIGDIALVPGPFMKKPKGIRDISEWYMSTVMRTDFLKEIFERQTDIAVQNFEKLFQVVGNKIDVVFICGTDFGTQSSQFCDEVAFRDLWLPAYKKMNDWIHSHTTWKTFKHSCGAVKPLINVIHEAGFDILNPVQISADGMDSKKLKEKYGDLITFWGGGIDTQKVLPYGTEKEIEKQVLEQCRILSTNGGYVFNTVHNIQANVPPENLIAMLNAIKKVNGEF